MALIRNKLSAFATLLLLGVLSGALWLASLGKGEPLHIALVGPQTGMDELDLAIMERAVRVYVDEVNRRGGVAGHPLLIEVYDDENDPDKAAEAAQKIVADNRAVAVIGHSYVDTCLAGNEFYAQAGIPVISPTATNTLATADNKWAFRAVFNDRVQGKQLANYAQSLFQPEKITLIAHELTYGQFLADIFGGRLEKMGVQVVNRQKFVSSDDDEEQMAKDLDEVVANIAQLEDPGVIFFAGWANEGAEFVRRLRDKQITNTVVGTDTLSSEYFHALLSELPAERLTPGFYTDNVYFTTPISFDLVSQKAKDLQDLFQRSLVMPDDESCRWIGRVYSQLTRPC